ncbi:unnamed protein product, partial [Brenthis ino]
MSDTNTSSNDVDREEFYRRVHELLQSKTAPNTFLLTAAKYARLLLQVKEAKTKIKKEPADYRRIKRYDIISTPQGERLVMANTDGKKQQMFVGLEEIYDIIREYHIKMNHAGRTRLMNAIKPKYKNITTQIVMLYLSLCEGCKNKVVKRNRIFKQSDNSYSEMVLGTEKSNEVADTNPLKIEVAREFVSTEGREDFSDCDMESIEEDSKIFPELFSRGQMDILDVMTVSGDNYKYLMVYRNLVTKFIHLKPLKTINIEESVDALLDIFLVFGAPNILQSKNGISVTKQICRRMYTVFPEIKVMAGEVTLNKIVFKGESNEDILKLLRDWCKDNKTQMWYQGVKYVQHMLNSTFNIEICRTPSESVFGSNPKKGIASFMGKNDYDHLVTEQDLKTALEEKESGKNSEQLLLEESLIPSCSFIKLEMETNQEFNDDDSSQDN